jgi:hypothetical protein
MEYTLTILSNIFIIACLSLIIVFTIDIYHIVRASSIWWLLMGWSYILAWRLVVLVESIGTTHTGWLQSHSAWFLLPFYPAVVIGTWKLMRSLRNPTTNK